MGILLSRLLLAKEDATGARKEIENAEALSKRIGEHVRQFEIATVRARVLSALDQPEAAKKLLLDTMAKLDKTAFVRYQFEARLALGEIERKSGQNGAGRGAPTPGGGV